MRFFRALAVAAILLSGAALAGEADVVAARATREASGTWRFEVTVRHADDGWKHFADRWEVVTPDGKVLATRVLMHPHETEQPFTRSMGGVEIPASIDNVVVRARDSLHGYGGAEVIVTLAD
jgi:hypothetical protein